MLRPAVQVVEDDRTEGLPMCFQNMARRKAHRFVYGDGVAYHSRDSLMAFTWGCTLDFLAAFFKIWKVFWHRDLLTSCCPHILLSKAFQVQVPGLDPKASLEKEDQQLGKVLAWGMTESSATLSALKGTGRRKTHHLVWNTTAETA